MVIRYRIFVFIVLIHLSVARSVAQINVGGSQNLQSLNGAVLTPDKVSETQGSFFYKDEYIRGSLTDAKGQTYSNISIKINFRTNAIYYLDEKGSEMQAMTDIRRIVLQENGKETVFENFFPAIEKQTAASIYQVLTSGKAKLLLSTQFSEVEYKEFNSAVTTNRIDKINQLFAFNKGVMIRITKGEQDVLSLLADQATAVAEYIKQHHLKCKKQPDLEAVFNYYNGL